MFAYEYVLGLSVCVWGGGCMCMCPYVHINQGIRQMENFLFSKTYDIKGADPALIFSISGPVHAFTYHCLNAEEKLLQYLYIYLK